MVYKASKFQIHFETWGDPKDRPVLFFHGFPGSHVQARPMISYLAHHGIFLIAVDRPGYGGTTGKGKVPDFLDDLWALLAGNLNLTRVDVVGVSGGAPWAHLMASRFADRVRALAIVCGLATYNQETEPYFSKAQNRALRTTKLLPTFAIESIVKQALKSFDPKTKLEGLIRYLHPTDQEVLNKPEVLELVLTSMEAARLQGPKGILYDSAVYQTDWLKTMCDRRSLNSIPTLYFHGKQDKLLDYRMSEWMHAQNPNSKLKLYEQEGHYSLPIRHANAILSEISKI